MKSLIDSLTSQVDSFLSEKTAESFTTKINVVKNVESSAKAGSSKINDFSIVEEEPIGNKFMEFRGGKNIANQAGQGQIMLKTYWVKNIPQFRA